MAANELILIAPVGLPAAKVRLLTSMFLLSRSRPRSYALATRFEEAKILMVDADNAGALASWRTMLAARPGVPTVFVSQRAAWILSNITYSGASRSTRCCSYSTR